MENNAENNRHNTKQNNRYPGQLQRYIVASPPQEGEGGDSLRNRVYHFI